MELKILEKSPLTPLFQRGEPIVIPLFPRGKYFSSLGSPTQPPAQKSLWLGESGL